MNMVRELRIKKGIQAKQLALDIGVSNATVSDWEHGRKNPTGARLKKLADYFGVDEGFVLGYGLEKPNLFVPENPQTSGKSETDQILEHILERLDNQPKTPEARAVSYGMDSLPKEQRELILNMVTAMYPQTFNKKGDDDDSRL